VPHALALLSSTGFSDEKKGMLYDQDVLKAMRGMFPAGKEYRFDMFANTSVGTGSVATILTALAISPAVVSYQEWTALASLFDEVRLVRAQLEFIPCVGSDGQNLLSSTAAKLPVTAIVCGANHNNISTLPASFVAVARLAKAAQVIRTVGDTRGQSIFTLKPGKGLGWARTVTPAVIDPPAGVLGSFDLATDSASLSMNVVYYRNMLRCVVSLRNRA